MSRKKEQDFIKTVLEYLGLESRTVKHGELWFHPEKNFSIQLAGTTGDVRSIKNTHADVSRKVKENYSFEEITELLNPLMKKRKLKVAQDGKIKIGAFYKNLDVNDKFLFDLNEPPKKRISTKVSEDTKRSIKNFAELNDKTMGEVIDDLVNMNKHMFDGIPDNPKEKMKELKSSFKLKS